MDNKKTCFAAVVTSTNAQTKKTTFLNFPVTALLPDQTTIEGTYSSGGEAAVLKNIKNQLQLPINKTIQIDTDKIGELIEATGGINLQNPKAFVANSYQFNQGSIQLSNSAQVKAYLSLVDENDQAALVTRIQNVSMALYGNIQKLAHAKQISSINTYRNILYAFSDTVKTDISFNEFKTIAFNYNKSLTTTSKLNLHTTDVSGSKVVSAQELTNIKKLFNQSLK